MIVLSIQLDSYASAVAALNIAISRLEKGDVRESFEKARDDLRAAFGHSIERTDDVQLSAFLRKQAT